MIPRTKILPLLLGGERDQAYAAFKGDKLLGAAAIKALMKNENDANNVLAENGGQQQQHSRGSATRLVSMALSNSFMAANVEMILPEYVEDAKGLSDHQVGTMLEAAVAQVHEADEAAVLDLASWLITTAADQPDPNVKGSLLNLGGTVEAERIGGSDHAAVFQATATYREHAAVATGESKKKAEQLAAGRLLENWNWNPGTKMKTKLAPRFRRWMRHALENGKSMCRNLK